MSWLDYGYPMLHCTDKRRAIMGYVMAIKERSFLISSGINELPDFDSLFSMTGIYDCWNWAERELDGMINLGSPGFFRNTITINDLPPLGNITGFNALIDAQFTPRFISNNRLKNELPTRTELLQRYAILNTMYRANSVTMKFVTGDSEDKVNLNLVAPNNPPQHAVCNYSYYIYTPQTQTREYFSDTATVEFLSAQEEVTVKTLHIPIDVIPQNTPIPNAGSVIADFSPSYQFLDVDV